jgi:hypothetical protein
MRYLCVLAVVCAGCAKATWHHPNHTPELFKMDNSACEDRAVDAASKGSRREKAIYSSCMNEKGWKFDRQYD